MAKVSFDEKSKAVGPLVVTLISFGVLVWWLIVVFMRLSAQPKVSPQGMIVDEYQRAKDVLLLVFPFASAALGYWLGQMGKAKAEEKASKSQEQLNAVVATSGDSGILDKVRTKYPDLFK